MPLDRLIHPRLGDSEKVTKLTDMEFRVWIAYVLAADDFGVMPKLAAKIQGVDRALGTRKKIQIDRALDVLLAVGLVKGFEHQGAPFLFTPSWQKHQRIRYPRRSHFPPPPVGRCDAETAALVQKFCGNVSESFPESCGEDGKPKPTYPQANANGIRLTAVEKKEGEVVDGTEPMDEWARELVNLAHPKGRCLWNLVERPLYAALTSGQLAPTAREAWVALKARLEEHKRSAQWRQGRVKRLDRWLAEGVYLQELPEFETTELVTDREMGTLSAAAAIKRGAAS